MCPPSIVSDLDHTKLYRKSVYTFLCWGGKDAFPKNRRSKGSKYILSEVDQQRFRCSWRVFPTLICWWNWLSRMTTFLISLLKSTGDQHALAPSNPFSDTGWEINPGGSQAAETWVPYGPLFSVEFRALGWDCNNACWDKGISAVYVTVCHSFIFIQCWRGDRTYRCKCIKIEWTSVETGWLSFRWMVPCFLTPAMTIMWQALDRKAYM